MTLIRKQLQSKVCALRLGAVLTLLIAGLFTGVSSANACAELAKSAASPSMPWLEHQDDSDWQQTVVGLWHVNYTLGDGTPFTQTFKMFWSEGIELENALNPPAGAFCYGVWKQVGHATVKIHHIGILWGSDGKISGTFTIDEEDTVASSGKSYSGNFEFKQYDPSGNPVADIKGTTSAKRVTFKTQSTEVD
jgi:hypothetical protein